MRSAKSGPNLWEICQVFVPWANGQITMTVHNYRPRQFHRSLNGENPSSGYRDMGSASLAAARPAARPPARPPEPWRQYPSSPKGWGVKRNWAQPCLAPCSAKTSTTTMQNKWVLVFHREEFQLPPTSQCHETIENTRYFYVSCVTLLIFFGINVTVGHRRQVTAVTRLPRWRRRKPRFQGRT